MTSAVEDRILEKAFSAFILNGRLIWFVNCATSFPLRVMSHARTVSPWWNCSFFVVTEGSSSVMNTWTVMPL